MASLAELIGSYTPLTRTGEQWVGPCIFEQHEGQLEVIAERWRCVCGAHDGHDDATGFMLLALPLMGEREIKPTLLIPTPPPSKWAISRAAQRDGTVLITDHRKAAAVAAKLLPRYAVAAWPDGGSRWDGLEPLRGRNVLLWPSPEGADAMERLEAVLADPAGLACTGKICAPLDLAEWTGTAEELIAWAKAHVRPLRVPNPAGVVAGATFASPPAGNVVQASPPSSEAPAPPAGPDAGAPQSDLSGSEPPRPQDTDFPAKASQRKPSKPVVACPAPDWPSILQSTKQGYLNNLDNVVRVIENDPTIKGRIWYDEFLDAICSDWQDPARRWRDSDDVLLQLYVQRHIGLTKVGVATVHDAALVAAFRNVRNECREWLEAVQWDQTERLAYVLNEAFGATQSAYTQAVGRCWFISMVARVMEPGCKVDTVPVLEGAQGVGKSSALKVIGGKWFAECHESVLTKDWYGVLDGHMLVEISEMHSFTRGEVERVKGLISCQVDRYRKAYGRNTEDHPRQSVLVCTTNRDDWQRDETGARRFWPVLCGAIDQNWLRTNRENLFAEAVHLYRQGVQWWMSDETDQSEEVEKRRDADSWEPIVREWLKGRDAVTTGDVLSGCLDLPANKQDVIYQRRIARVFRALEWKQRVVKEDGVNRRVWLKPRPR